MKFFGWLALAFIVLKLCGVITWSWWLVLLPLYWVVALILIAVAGVFGFAFIADGVDKVKSYFGKSK
ncbi:hypothetical protein pEaSNUABM56_00090 [Erwinia phage pEa_SNUABM_56]|uniref:Uncharacterized protein n=1 Tax=Erwinia phage pEp_SNUABM_01 TaxID=2601643 RepID=A0A5J6DAI6_9CAUD|nr:hypothetical protein HWC63_gp063 [Erwinia phage pEp_SNUABM_01]QEQ94889.1 hypothetical protein pEpSNUABM01_063 [Erwinia phage pEp_SNUABM_01]UYL84820.1 hypothetical protein pEaSNUABM55_00022 [Erwinia phage pEa_SNUABM_55]UYL85135.1 hypothetical protein pEaSNUABM56_00090 [Erwinia phage pEa_SNUABM_56]